MNDETLHVAARAEFVPAAVLVVSQTGPDDLTSLDGI